MNSTFSDEAGSHSFGFELPEDVKSRAGKWAPNAKTFSLCEINRLTAAHATTPSTFPDFSSLTGMSADDSSFPGWASHRSGADDVFTSPIFTDPSPALTDNNSFDVESCDPSPLVRDDLEAPQGEFANVPLFNDMTLFSPAQRVEHSFDQQQQQEPLFHGAAGASADFTLFPEVRRQSSSPPRAQMAFSGPASSEDPSAMLLRALQGAVAAQTSQAPVSSASPALISSPPKEATGAAFDLYSRSEPHLQNQPHEHIDAGRRPLLQHSATAPSLTVTQEQQPIEEATAPEAAEVDAESDSRPIVKKRPRVQELLPLDAPIQSRNYLGPSATSRKDWVPPSSIDQGPTAEEMAAINAETDPLKAKRLSNTLAARRSRHRKAQERQEFQDKIAQLEAEVAQWKKRCERAEEERDEYSQKRKQCKCT